MAITNIASDSEATDKHIVPTWLLLLVLLLGVVASVVGYVGCFSVVQSTEKSTGPLSWLCLEAALSLLRMYIWSLDPQSDDAPPLEFVLALDDEPPLPTCNRYSECIDEDKVLPLTRADQFLNSVTSFTGLIDRFHHPDLTLYYALTRRHFLGIEPKMTPSEWVLYITIFDHKERTARVYTRGDTPSGFRAIASSVPTIDLEHGVLETDLGETIDIEHDPIVGVDGIRTLLEAHYQSIMGPYSTMAKDRKYHIENRWTMKRADTMSAAHKEKGAGASGDGASTVKPGHKATLRDTWERDHQYLEQGQVERMLRMLYSRRGMWVERYMTLVTRQTRERFDGRETVRRVDGNTCSGKEKAIDEGPFWGESDARVVDTEREEFEQLIVEEWHWMEELLEVERWEEQLWERRKHFVSSSPEKQRLTREWPGHCWQRLDANIRAMNARMDAVKTIVKTITKSNEFDVSGRWQNTRDDIQQAWQAVVERIIQRDTSLDASSSMVLQGPEEFIRKITEPPLEWMLSRNRERLKKQWEASASRLRRARYQNIPGERPTVGAESGHIYLCYPGRHCSVIRGADIRKSHPEADASLDTRQYNSDSHGNITPTLGLILPYRRRHYSARQSSQAVI